MKLPFDNKKRGNNGSEIKEQDRKRSRTVVAFILLALSIAVLSAIIFSVTGVFTWFSSGGTEGTITAKAEDFRIVPMVNGTQLTDATSGAYFDPYAANSTPTVNLIYSGDGDAYIRVRLTESFFDSSNNILPSDKISISYSLASGWTYNSSDGYYYYSDIVTSGSTISFITGKTSPSADGTKTGNIRVSLDILAEGVQPDRREAFFN